MTITAYTKYVFVGIHTEGFDFREYVMFHYWNDTSGDKKAEAAQENGFVTPFTHGK